MGIDIMYEDINENIRLVATKTAFAGECDEWVKYVIVAYKNGKKILDDSVAYINVFKLQCGKKCPNNGALIDYQSFYGEDNSSLDTDYCGIIYNENNTVCRAIREKGINYLAYSKFRTDLIEKILYEDYHKKDIS